ncbi:MAG: SOS response-associated peptidase family protein [Corynebacterium sp.]|nr:SOS response-associated peptidase family protein [Corynebacterium sp.]
MCNHYEPVIDAATLASFIPLIDMDAIELWTKTNTRANSMVWPGYSAPIIMPTQEKLNGAQYTVADARFGLIPKWVKPDAIGSFRGSTFNARTETISQKPSFRDAWRKNQFCIIPAYSFFEPDWRTGKSIDTKIERKDKKPIGIAGLWEENQAGELSFTMLTINAAEHPIMQNFHRPEKEKRSVVILPPAYYENWLSVTASDAPLFFKEFPADLFQTVPAKKGPSEPDILELPISDEPTSNSGLEP